MELKRGGRLTDETVLTPNNKTIIDWHASEASLRKWRISNGIHSQNTHVT